MKFLIGSDIHGSFKYASMFFKIADEVDPTKILLLGDCYYNGARNDPPEEYAPKKVVSLLNEHADKIIAVKGNCESEVDQMVSKFLFNDNASLFVFGKVISLAHGHHYSFDNLPEGKIDIFIQGHTHIGVLEKKGDIILANPGSISLPKDGHHSYMIMDEGGISLIDLIDGTVLRRLDF